jgi:ketosteroid isomerase-like protein
MKKILIPILFMVILSSCKTEVVIDKEAESKAIQSVVESMFSAIADMDYERFITYTCDEFFAYDMAQLMKPEDMSKAFEGMSQMGYSNLKFEVIPVEFFIYETHALACFKTSGTATIGDQDVDMEFLESYFMLKVDDVWKIRFFHSTQLPPPAPDTPVAD